MENAKQIGKAIRQKRLFLNLTMNYVASKANVSRATLWSIEKGNGNYSVEALLRVLSILDLKLSIERVINSRIARKRATRTLTKRDKEINKFIVFCVEQYAKHCESDSKHTYELMLQKGIIDEIKNDYDDLHGMSTMYLNDYFDSLIEQ